MIRFPISWKAGNHIVILMSVRMSDNECSMSYRTLCIRLLTWRTATTDRLFTTRSTIRRATRMRAGEGGVKGGVWIPILPICAMASIVRGLLSPYHLFVLNGMIPIVSASSLYSATFLSNSRASGLVGVAVTAPIASWFSFEGFEP